jgi:uncharacterized protein (TIGR02466 family)
MELTPIFSVGAGKSQTPELLPIARQLFYDNKHLLSESYGGLRTTLQRYNSMQDCVTLNNQEAVHSLKQAIKINAINFYAGLGFDVEKLDFEVVNLWLNEMCAGSSHPPHSHYGFQLSGCFYVDVPDGSGLIKLYTTLQRREHGDNPAKELGQYNAEFYGICPKEGDMLFWESLITHEVPPLEFHGIRRSIAYDLKISKKISSVQLGGNYKMNLQDYVAIYNINNPSLCQKVVQMMKEEHWLKHSYCDPITGEHTTYHDDLDMSYQDDATTNDLQRIFKQCAAEYLATVAPVSFPLQELTRIRFNRYNVGTNMKMHHDHIHTIFDGERKGVPILSFLALLNDDFEGGDFLMFDGKKLKLSMGDVVVFPSNFLYPHAVTTVTKGTRYSCVSWGY